VFGRAKRAGANMANPQRSAPGPSVRFRARDRQPGSTQSGYCGVHYRATRRWPKPPHGDRIRGPRWGGAKCKRAPAGNGRCRRSQTKAVKVHPLVPSPSNAEPSRRRRQSLSQPKGSIRRRRPGLAQGPPVCRFRAKTARHQSSPPGWLRARNPMFALGGGRAGPETIPKTRCWQTNRTGQPPVLTNQTTGLSNREIQHPIGLSQRLAAPANRSRDRPGPTPQ
jgi:hypothetical protein